MIFYNLKPLSGGALRPFQDFFRAVTDLARASFNAFNPLSYLGGLGTQGR